MDGEPDTPFQITYSKALLDCLRQWAERAKQVGVLEEVTDAFVAVEHKLAGEPLAWGEPLRNLRDPSGVMRVAVQGIFGVTYAVYPEKRLVWVTRYRLLPHHPLGAGPDACP